MKDFIFIIGPSGVGKSTLAKGLFAHYQGALAEMNMVPEFGIPQEVDPGVFEEKVCWECCVAQLKKFHELGIRHIISGDFDDLRTRDIPAVFKSYQFITLKLICSDEAELQQRMENRGKGLIDFKLQKKMTEKINARPLLLNEVLLDTAGKSEEKVLEEAIGLIEQTESLVDYTYEMPEKELFYSWVKSNHLN